MLVTVTCRQALQLISELTLQDQHRGSSSKREGILRICRFAARNWHSWLTFLCSIDPGLQRWATLQPAILFSRPQAGVWRRSCFSVCPWKSLTSWVGGFAKAWKDGSLMFSILLWASREGTLRLRLPEANNWSCAHCAPDFLQLSRLLGCFSKHYIYIYTHICILDIMIPVADYSAWNREWLVFRPEYCRSVWIPTILERFSPSCALFQLQQPLGWVEFLLPIYCKPFFPANLRCNAARKGLTMVPEAGLGMEQFLSVSCSERRFSSMKSDNMWQPSFFIFFQQAIHTCSFPVKALAVMSWRGPPCRVNTHEARSVSFGPDMFGQWNQLINSSATQSH